MTFCRRPPPFVRIFCLLCSAACGEAHEAPRPVESRAPSAESNAWAELAALDSRRPLPLQPMMAWHQKQNMMAHLEAVQHIVDGLAREDWDAIDAAASTIASSPNMRSMCQHMGAGADGFTPLALEFHERADGIARAAAQQSAVSVLQATSYTLEACVSCHATFRQEVVDATTWSARTGAGPTLSHE